MEKILDILETLSKYGIIDILFGVGIVALLQKVLKRRKTSDIEGVDLMPYIDINRGLFILLIKNQSSEPLYLYRAYVEPGYHTEKLDKSTFSKRILTSFFMTWKTDKFPKVIGQPKTTKGLHILQLLEEGRGLAPTLFIEPSHSGEYKLTLDKEDLGRYDNVNDLFEKQEFGILKVNFVHGTKSGLLEVQL